MLDFKTFFSMHMLQLGSDLSVSKDFRTKKLCLKFDLKISENLTPHIY